MQPAVTVFASDLEQQLKDWVTRRQQLVESVSREKHRQQQLHSTRPSPVQEDVAAHIDWLQQRIRQFDEKI